MLSNEAKYTSSYKFFNLLVQFVALKGRPLSRKRPSNVLSVWGRQIERVGRSKLIQTNLTEPDVKLFMYLNSTCLVRLMKSSTFGLRPYLWVQVLTLTYVYRFKVILFIYLVSSQKHPRFYNFATAYIVQFTRVDSQ